MEAKDTVISGDNLKNLTGHWAQENPLQTEYSLNTLNKCLSYQAESSFKAGEENVVEFILPRLSKISEIIADIRGDWTDPRSRCREAHLIITEIEEFLKSEGIE